MPYYHCLTPPGTLTAADRQRLADEITDIHCANTGGLALFVQVHFEEVAVDHVFQNRKPSSAVRLHIRMRSGRSDDTRKKMLTEYTHLLSRVARVPVAEVMVAIIEVPHTNVMEGGIGLPAPGDEAEWMKQFEGRETLSGG
jgi:phenylpyruvate tautomerase PptA (4-oxalocrotonate tautomerase family)